jgi:dihydroorotase
VHVVDGVITSLGEGKRSPAHARIVDARGMYVLPGAIDVHVHSRDPGFPEKEDFGTLTAAAAAGGVTTVVDMPNTVPGVDSGGVLEAKAALAHSKARVDFGLWGLIRSSSTVQQLEGLAQSGAIGFKAYLGYAFSLSRKQVLYTPDTEDPDLEAPPDYGTLLRLAPVVAALGLPLVIHAEDPGILAAFRRPLGSYADVLGSRPAEAEAVAISAAAAITDSFGTRLHIAHLSSALGLMAAEAAIRDGSRVSLETCPQYLLLTDQDFDRLGTLMKMFPPVRTAHDRDALLDALARAVIKVVATDHAPHTDEEKSRPLDQAAAGSPGVQTLYLSCLELAKRWAKGTAILFAVGAVSGTVLSFELGLLWPGFMEFAGPVIGMPFSLEGFAFFTEAIFLGVYLYGWDRISATAHMTAGLIVAASGAASAVFVVMVNAWMNTPTGLVVKYRLDPADGIALNVEGAQQIGFSQSREDR